MTIEPAALTVSFGSSRVFPMSQDEKVADRQVLVVMRHGKRHDSDNPKWSYVSPCPWDTPLSKRGIGEIERVSGPKLEALQPEVVVVSPFLRCMQTAHRVVSSWSKKPQGLRIVIDKQFAEVYQPTLLHLTENPSCLAILKRWWWQTGWKERATALLGNLEGVQLEFCSRSWPPFPEDKYDGRARFSRAMDYWGDRCKGSNVLIITHGDAVLSGINKVQRHALVDNVHPGGYMVMARSRGPPAGKWEFDQSLVPWDGVEMAPVEGNPTMAMPTPKR